MSIGKITRYYKKCDILKFICIIFTLLIFNIMPFFLMNSIFWEGYSIYQFFGIFSLNILIDLYLIYSIFYQRESSFFIGLFFQFIWFYYVFYESIITSLKCCALFCISIIFLILWLQERKDE